MPQSDLLLGLSIAGTVFGGLALTWNIVSWCRNTHWYKYDVLDKQLFELLKVNMDYPEFRDQKFIEDLENIENKDTESKQQYAIFAGMSLNLVETAVHKYKLNLDDTHFGPAMKAILTRHKTYYTKNQDAYKSLAPLYKKIG